MLHSFSRWAACLAASFALIGGAAAQSGTTPQAGATSAGSGDQSSGATQTPPAMRHGDMSRHRGQMRDRHSPSMRHGATAASPSGTSATMSRDQRMATGDLSRDCAPTAAGASTTPITQAQNREFRNEMSQCTSETNRDERAACVREVWESSGGTAACM